MTKQRINLETDSGVYSIDVPNPVTIETLTEILDIELLSIASRDDEWADPVFRSKYR